MSGDHKVEEKKGVIPRTFKHVFKNINATPNCKFIVRCSMLEIYNEKIRDLLASNPKNKLDLRENKDKGVYVRDLTF